MNKPKYLIIKESIKEDINNNVLVIGDKLPSVDYYVDKFGFSPVTINKAINELTQEGILNRIKSQGTFVISKEKYKPITAKKYSSLSEDIRAMGKVPSSKLISYEIIFGRDNIHIARLFSIGDDETMHYFRRIRYADNEPIAYVESYIPTSIIPTLDVKALDQGSLMEYLNSTGFQGTHYSYRKIKTIAPDDQQEKYLLLNDSAEHLLLVMQLSVDYNNRPYHYNNTYYVTSRYEYTMTSVASNDKEENLMEKMQKFINM